MKKENKKEEFNLDDILRRVEEILKNHPRQDAEFRMNIILSQIGDICRYIIHDGKLCPGAKPYGTKFDEEDTFGHTLVQLLVAAKIRDINVKKAILGAMKSIEDKEWARRERKHKEGYIEGIVAHPGEVIGIAFVDPHGRRLDSLDGHILVIENVRPKIAIYLKKIKGMITNHGGKFSHAGILAREHNIPCIVGTGNATEIIGHGQKIKIQANSKKNGIIHLKVE